VESSDPGAEATVKSKWPSDTDIIWSLLSLIAIYDIVQALNSCEAKDDMIAGQILLPSNGQSTEELTWLRSYRSRSAKAALHRELSEFVEAASTMDDRTPLSSKVLSLLWTKEVSYEGLSESSVANAEENAASWEAAERLEGAWWPRFKRSVLETWEAFWRNREMALDWEKKRSEKEVTLAEWHGIAASEAPRMASEALEGFKSVPKLSGTVV
jgi:hypothetical protein